MSRKWIAAICGAACLLALAVPLGLAGQEKEKKSDKAKKEKKENPKAVVEGYKARLKAVESLGFTTVPTGNVTYKRRANGEETLEVLIRDLEVPDRTEPDRVLVDLVIEGRPVASVEVRQMRGRLKIQGGRDKAATIPKIQSGQLVELRRQGRVIMRGNFRKG